MKADDQYFQKMLIENWRREMQATKLYQLAAENEVDSHRREILFRLADVEKNHAQMWSDKLKEQGFPMDSLEEPKVSLAGMSALEIVNRIEEVEGGNSTWYNSLRNVIDDEDILRMIDRIDEDERQHGDVGELFQTQQKSARKRLKSIWGEERWHRRESGGWVGDAIYGVNDGLGAIFGIIAGVAGYAHADKTILISGFFGALASTLSMGAGAWLAAKSENELLETELQHERREIEEDPSHEIEELKLLYQLKGLSEEESERISSQVSQDPENFLKTMAQEELGIHETSTANPWNSALFGSASTFVGAIIPLLPFFFLHGWKAMLIAAVVSLIAHFVVGALKSIITARSWWASGFEMTVVGLLVGVVSYGLGELGSLLLG